MIQNIKDRVPVNVLSNDAIRYGIYDEQGNLVRYEYIKREDEPAENGTPINKALLNNLQGDLYTVDRYNKSVVNYENLGIGLVEGNIIPNSWEKENNLKYVSTNGTILTSSSSGSSVGLLNQACDGNSGTEWQSERSTSTREEWFEIEFPSPQKITKLKAIIRANRSFYQDYSSCEIQGGNGDAWDTLYSISVSSLASQAFSDIITFDNPKYYKKYRIYAVLVNYELIIREITTIEYEGDMYDYVNNLSLPLTLYEKGKIVNIEGSSFEDITSFENSYLNINNLGAKQINGTIEAGEKYNLVYNGESWDIFPPEYCVTGTYNGNGENTNTLNLGFLPKLILIEAGGSSSGTTGESGVIFPTLRYAVCRATNVSKAITPTLNISGTKITISQSDGYCFNTNNRVYRYIAFR